MANAAAQSLRASCSSRLHALPRALPAAAAPRRCRIGRHHHSCLAALPPAAIATSNGASPPSIATSNGHVASSTLTPHTPQPVVQPIVVNVPEPKPAVLPPNLNFQNVVSIGKAKVSIPSARVFAIGTMAGIFIGFGCCFMAAVSGSMPGLAASNPGLHKLLSAIIFPVGLLMVVINAPELYTGNTAITTAAVLEGEMSVPQLLRNWFFSFTGNFAGSLLMVAAITAAGSLAGNAMPVNMAVAKTSLSFGTAFLRAILANWLVCVAVFHASSASSLPGKMMGLWMPITAFTTLGLEHSIANMFTIPMGIMLGADVSVADFLLKNLLPVTLGNTVAGVLMATAMAVCYGSLGRKLFPAPAAAK